MHNAGKVTPFCELQEMLCCMGCWNPIPQDCAVIPVDERMLLSRFLGDMYLALHMKVTVLLSYSLVHLLQGCT